MAGRHPALRQLRVDLLQPAGDVLVGQAVKAVPADPLLVPGIRDREPVGDLGMVAVERGIEAGDLGDIGMAGADLPDRRQIVRLVQRGQRHELLEAVQHRVVHQGRCREIRPTMHDPVADRTWHAAKPPDQPRLEPAQRRAQVGGLVGRVGLVDQDAADI